MALSTPTQTLSFNKLHASGNDFILIEDFDLSVALDKATISHLCQRRTGVGADGLILIQPSKVADFKMVYFNSDGSVAPFCGNGLRCVVFFLTSDNQAKISIETGAGIHWGCREKEGVHISLPKPECCYLNQNFAILGQAFTAHKVIVGVPHIVCFVEDLETFDVTYYGASLHHLDSNINFAEMGDNGEVHLRTFERGVNDETLACGSGGGAAAFVANQIYGQEPKRGVVFRHGERALYCASLEHLSMEGTASFVYKGVLSC